MLTNHPKSFQIIADQFMSQKRHSKPSAPRVLGSQDSLRDLPRRSFYEAVRSLLKDAQSCGRSQRFPVN